MPAIETTHPDADEYWASESIENEAVAEWWAQQPESRQRPGTGTDQCDSGLGCPSC